jgi:hypothetical protein
MLTDFRAHQIQILQRRIDNCVYALTKTYRHDLVLIFHELEREIQIQKCYQQAGI